MTRSVPIVLVAWLSILVAACGIFEPRDPEPPAQTGSNYIPPTEPSIVFTNMANAFREMNAVNYLRSFSEISTAEREFVFEPTIEARQNYGGVFAVWTRESEQKYFDNLKSNVQSGSSPSLVFGTPVALSIQSDSAQYEISYTLAIPQQSGTLSAEGTAVYHMLADKSRNWVIWRWVDISKTQGAVTWSDVKGQFGQ
jgi:hypothetical protein